ncbi:hypothetical protein EV714DRAFT_238514 [Schizophyllum commune]
MQFFNKVFAAVALFAVAASAMPASDLEIETRADPNTGLGLDHLPPRWAAYLLRVLKGVMSRTSAWTGRASVGRRKKFHNFEARPDPRSRIMVKFCGHEMLLPWLSRNATIVRLLQGSARMKGGRSQANAAFTALVAPSASAPSNMQFFIKAFAALALVAVTASALPVTNRGDESLTCRREVGSKCPCLC